MRRIIICSQDEDRSTAEGSNEDRSAAPIAASSRLKPSPGLVRRNRLTLIALTQYNSTQYTTR